MLAGGGLSGAGASCDADCSELAVPSGLPGQNNCRHACPVLPHPNRPAPPACVPPCPVPLQDREACDELYRTTKRSVEGGLAYLLEQRKRDPYGEFLPRSLYEAAYRGRQAPTFPLDQ